MYGHIRLKEQKLSNLLISEKVSLNLCSMATLQPQRVQHFTQGCFVSCYTIFLWAPESVMDIIQLHRIKKKHLKNKQRNTIKYILKKKKW